MGLSKTAFLERYDCLLTGLNTAQPYGPPLVELDKSSGSTGLPRNIKQRAQWKFVEILRNG